MHLQSLPSLETLFLPSEGVTGKGFRHLTKLPIKRLGLAAALTLEDNERVYTALAQMKHLKRLDLERSAVTNAHLASLASVKQLRTLQVRETKVTAAGVRQLQAALPNLKISADPAILEDATKAASPP